MRTSVDIVCCKHLVLPSRLRHRPHRLQVCYIHCIMKMALFICNILAPRPPVAPPPPSAVGELGSYRLRRDFKLMTIIHQPTVRPPPRAPPPRPVPTPATEESEPSPPATPSRPAPPALPSRTAPSFFARAAPPPPPVSSAPQLPRRTAPSLPSRPPPSAVGASGNNSLGVTDTPPRPCGYFP